MTDLASAMPEGRRSRIAAVQRARRSRLHRIDYYPSEAAASLIDSLRKPSLGGDASSIINCIIAEWEAANPGRVPEFSVAVTREMLRRQSARRDVPASGVSPAVRARTREATAASGISIVHNARAFRTASEQRQ